MILTPIGVILILFVACLINMAVFKDPFERVYLTKDAPAFMQLSEADVDKMAQHLADAIAIKTISTSETEIDFDELLRLNDYIETTFSGKVTVLVFTLHGFASNATF